MAEPEKNKQETIFGGSAKTFHRLSDDPWIEVLCPSTVTGQTEPYSFQTSMIDHLEGAGKNRSAIVLQSGTVVILSLPYADLAEKISEGASPLDLKEFCKTLVPGGTGPQVGDRMEDDSVFAGISPDTRKPIYVAPADESLSLTFNEAQKRAEEKSQETGTTYRLPSASELGEIFNNRAAIGGFSGSWYWSA
ncbi:MAG: hypothetical protein HY052_07925, partial [Proteobacteria bacterium]|nr:hypothetical protein [Pseudomonadota bacterium]